MLQLPSRDDARQLYAFFTESGYTEKHILDRFGAVETTTPQLRNLPRLLDQTRGHTPLNMLVRWFLVGVPADADHAQGLFPKWFLKLVTRIGLLEPGEDKLIPSAQLLPYGQLLIASDLIAKLGSSAKFNHVLTLNPAAEYLLRFTIRKPCEAALDLCAGCGIHALAAAGHCQRVTATDLNPRATEYAAFNARLNGFNNIQCLTGDTYEPVQGQKFDLIICNPPFILAPSKNYLYRDNDMELDRFCGKIIQEAPSYLNEGGYFQMICEWAQIKDEPWQKRVLAWFEGLDCDVWVLKDYTQAPALYAQTRMRETIQVSPEADMASYDQWMAYYRDKGVEAIHGGLIALRRRAGNHGVRIEELHENTRTAFGETILQGFGAREFLESHASDTSLLETTLTLSPQIRLDQECHCDQGAWQPKITRMRLAKGLPQTITVEPDIADFLVRFDGQHTVGQLVDGLAQRVGLEPGRIQGECLGLVRGMIERGFLLPGSQADAPRKQHHTM